MSSFKITFWAIAVLALLVFPVMADKESAKPKGKAAPVVKEEAKAEEKKEAEKSDAEEEKKLEPPKTHKVETGPIEVELELPGVVEAIEATPISLDPKIWAELTVANAVPHGTEVKKGDVIIELDPRKLKESLEEQHQGRPLLELALEGAKRELEVLEKTTPMSLESSRRSKMQAEEDLAYFEDVSKPMRLRDAKEDVKMMADYLRYAEEELNQLKKMYENDDLTEETEEIVLKRAQNDVDAYVWRLEQTKARSDRNVNVMIPREHESMKKSLESRQISWRAGERSMREALEKKKHEVAKQHRDFEKATQKIEKHEHDLKLMTVRAPHDGIVYYGMNQRGKWTTASTIERKLFPGGKLTPREVVMTVVNPNDLQLRVAVAEGKLKDLAVGQKGATTLKWNDEVEHNSTVKSISYTPLSNNTFDAIFSLSVKEKEFPVRPGMNGTSTLLVYENKDAILVPKGSIVKEDGESFVTLEGGKKQKVKPGRSDEKNTEILEGLKKGSVIELEPKSKKDDDAKGDKPGAGDAAKPKTKAATKKK